MRRHHLAPYVTPPGVSGSSVSLCRVGPLQGRTQGLPCQTKSGLPFRCWYRRAPAPHFRPPILGAPRGPRVSLTGPFMRLLITCQILQWTRVHPQRDLIDVRLTHFLYSEVQLNRARIPHSHGGVPCHLRRSALTCSSVSVPVRFSLTLVAEAHVRVCPLGVLRPCSPTGSYCPNGLVSRRGLQLDMPQQLSWEKGSSRTSELCLFLCCSWDLCAIEIRWSCA